jgi:uncharacterized protein (DUF924 family)
MWVEDVLHFWFEELNPTAWFERNDETDALIRERFGPLHEQLARGLLNIPATPGGHLAAIIVLDQFSRNLYRGAAGAFANDPKALEISQRAIEMGYDNNMTVPERQFLYMPFMHSENPADQQLCVALFMRLQDPQLLSFATEHHAIVEKFGRFPHRNLALNRPSTSEEIEFMKQHQGF